MTEVIMDNGSKRLFRTAHEQWATVQRILRMVSPDNETRKNVALEAEFCRSTLKDSLSRTPMSEDAMSGDVESLSSVLDDVIYELKTAAG